MSPRVVLASASAARLRVLRGAGLDPEVVVSGIDEAIQQAAGTASVVACLARRKAETVAAGVGAGALVVGCDSLLDVDGSAHGKPPSAAEAVKRWHLLRGRAATLFTGYCVIDTTTGRHAEDVVGTTVRFGRPTDAEVEAYVASGEPLRVAGGFTLEGLGGAFVEGVDGDVGNVLGLSPAVLRRLVGALGISWVELWR